MPTAQPSRIRLRACAQIVLGIVLFWVIDAAVFRTGLYFPWIAPTSGLGNMAHAIDSIQNIPPGRPSVLVIGDSRIGEGFSAELATLEAKRLGASSTFTSGAVAGTVPRVWYYLLRQIHEPAKRLAAVVIMTPSYHDNDPEPQAERRGDIVFVHPLLSLLDLIDFRDSFLSPQARLEAAEAILFKGLVYKNDVQDFLRSPAVRIHEAIAWRAHGLEWIGVYPGRNSSLAGLTFDVENGKLSVAPGHPLTQPNALAPYAEQLHQYRGRPPDNAAAAAYRRKWLGRIAEFCRQAGVKLIVFRIPRGPLHHLVEADNQPTGILAELARSGKLDLLPADTFDNLERPEFFFDELHLNRAGREVFSAELARAILPYFSAAK